jgi:Xaa-Pro dipeptidase
MIYNTGRLSKLMAANELELLIVSSLENINYFSGLRPVIKTLNKYYGECYIVIHVNTPHILNFVHSCGECDQLTECMSSLGHVFTYGTFYREIGAFYEPQGDEADILKWTMDSPRHANGREALLALIATIAPKRFPRIGYDQDGMPKATVEALSNFVGKNNLFESAALVRDVRKVKTVSEISGLSRAAQINEQAIYRVTEALQIGISENELKEIFESEVVKQGGRPELTMLKIGLNAVGGQRQQKKDITLTAGDLVWFDSNTSYRGYWADLARVVAFKDLNPATQVKYNALRKGMIHASEIAKPGITGAEVFNSTMEFIRDHGFSGYRRHHIGHGIGFEAYERPIMSPDENCCIEEGMVISLETPYYEFGLGALHIEDPVLIGVQQNTFLTLEPCPELKVIH